MTTTGRGMTTHPDLKRCIEWALDHGYEIREIVDNLNDVIAQGAASKNANVFPFPAHRLLGHRKVSSRTVYRLRKNSLTTGARPWSHEGSDPATIRLILNVTTSVLLASEGHKASLTEQEGKWCLKLGLLEPKLLPYGIYALAREFIRREQHGRPDDDLWLMLSLTPYLIANSPEAEPHPLAIELLESYRKRFKSLAPFAYLFWSDYNPELSENPFESETPLEWAVIQVIDRFDLDQTGRSRAELNEALRDGPSLNEWFLDALWDLGAFRPLVKQKVVEEAW